jgi:hypothetical protein
MEQYEQHFTKGFNNGYLLAKHDPDLAAQLAANPNDQNPYFEGLVSGKQEYEKEAREWSKSFARQGQEKVDRGLGKER